MREIFVARKLVVRTVAVATTALKTVWHRVALMAAVATAAPKKKSNDGHCRSRRLIESVSLRRVIILPPSRI